MEVSNLDKKKCGRCKEIKSVTEFTKLKRTPDGLDNYCKACKSKMNKRYRKHVAQEKPIKKTREPVMPKLERMKKEMIVPYEKAPKGAISVKSIEKKQYKKNRVYEVEYKSDKHTEGYFKGKLIDETNSSILLINKLNIRESFMKKDFKTGEKEIREVI